MNFFWRIFNEFGVFEPAQDLRYTEIRTETTLRRDDPLINIIKGWANEADHHFKISTIAFNGLSSGL